MKIEKGIPLPEDKPFSRERRSKYRFSEMEIGDSTSAPLQKEKVLRYVACLYGKRHQKKFTVRLVKENGKMKVRYWRIA